jgi:hypothetical protein
MKRALTVPRRWTADGLANGYVVDDDLRTPQSCRAAESPAG